jgi:hypothetical protein
MIWWGPAWDISPADHATWLFLIITGNSRTFSRNTLNQTLKDVGLVLYLEESKSARIPKTKILASSWMSWLK